MLDVKTTLKLLVLAFTNGPVRYQVCFFVAAILNRRVMAIRLLTLGPWPPCFLWSVLVFKVASPPVPTSGGPAEPF